MESVILLEPHRLCLNPDYSLGEWSREEEERETEEGGKRENGFMHQGIF